MTSNWKYTGLALGKIEFAQGNIELSIMYFDSLLDDSTKVYAIVYLGFLHIKQDDFLMTLKYMQLLKEKDIPYDLKTEVELLRLHILVNLSVIFVETKILANFNNVSVEW